VGRPSAEGSAIVWHDRAAMKRDAASLLALVVLAIGLTWGDWGSPSQWKPDALYYQAQLLEIRGVDRPDALDRVFTGPLAAPRRIEEETKPEAVPRITDPAWVEYSSQFYRRRWVVPVLGAAIEPVFGTDSLQIVSLVGFLLVGPLLYLLLRCRFRALESAVAAAICISLPPLRYWAEQPQTDSFAVAVEALALLLAVLGLDRGRRWLLPWALAVLVLGFTRDASAIVVGAMAWVAFRERTRRATSLLACGVLAALPPLLLFGAPLREAMAYTFSDFRIPEDTSWEFILRNYPKGLRRVQIHDMEYLVDHPLTALAAVSALVAVYAIRRSGDPYFTLMRAAGVACLAYLALLPNYTALRLELVLLPVVAVGLALLLTAAGEAVHLRRAAGVRPSAGGA
jgi:hypothetical protein